MNVSIAHERSISELSVVSAKRWARTDKAYFSAFVFATLLCFSPSKLLAYFAPIVVVALFIVVARKTGTLQRVLLVVSLSMLIIIFYALMKNHFAFVSAIVQLLTYSSFLVTVAIDHRYLRNPELQTRIENFVRWVVLVQSGVGITQAIHSFVQAGTFDSNSGDAVAGTISASLLPDGTLSNYMFGVNLTFILLFLVPSALLKRKGRWVLLLAAATFVFTSVIHVMIFLSISFVIAFVLCRPPLPKGWTKIIVFSATGGIIIAATTLLSTNWLSLPRMIQGVTSGEYPRGRAYERVFGVMTSEYPLMPIIGLGPGQFSSRAAAMTSGYYLGGIDNPNGLPLLPKSMSQAFNTYLLDLWFQSKDSAGSTSQPFSSWLATYTEFGGVTVLSLIAILGYHIVKIVLLTYRTKHRWLGTVWCTSVLFLFLLGFQDTYWEVPQAILLGVMLIKILQANIFVITLDHRSLVQIAR